MQNDKTRYKSKRRLIFKAADAVVAILDRMGKRTMALDPDKLIAKARKQTGLHDFGDDSFREPLRILCAHTHGDKPLTILGRIILKGDILNRLKNKLRIHAEIKAHPEILEQPMPHPIIIVGLPRTGTTLLQRLLAEDPDSRTLRSWEMIDPIPLPEPETFNTDPRIKKDTIRWNLYNWAVPHRMMHETGPTLPEECFSLMANDLISLWFYPAIDSTEYLQWFQGLDHTHTYRLHKRQLQLLQSKWPAGIHWVLKTHWHFYGLEWLLKVYPDARIVMTHRDLAKVIPSNASLITAVRSGFYKEVNPVAISNAYLDLFSSYFDRGLKARDNEEKRPGSKAIFYDLYYRDFTADPLAAVEKLYAKFKLELTPNTLERMRRFLAETPQHKLGKHKYTLEQFDLDEETLRRRFAVYYKRFGL